MVFVTFELLLSTDHANPSEYQSVITKLLDNLKSTDMSCSVRLFALLTLGGIGKHRLVFLVNA